VSAQKTATLDPWMHKPGPGIMCECSRSATAPRTGQNNPKTDLAVDGIEVHGSRNTFWMYSPTHMPHGRRNHKHECAPSSLAYVTNGKSFVARAIGYAETECLVQGYNSPYAVSHSEGVYCNEQHLDRSSEVTACSQGSLRAPVLARNEEPSTIRGLMLH
jgi:hypothetical protein